MRFSQMSKLGLPDFHLAQGSRQEQYVIGTEVTEQPPEFLCLKLAVGLTSLGKIFVPFQVI